MVFEISYLRRFCSEKERIPHKTHCKLTGKKISDKIRSVEKPQLQKFCIFVSNDVPFEENYASLFQKNTNAG